MGRCENQRCDDSAQAAVRAVDLGGDGGQAQVQVTLLHIAGMCCPTEESLIQRKLKDIPGVLNLEFNLIQRRLSVEHSPEALPGILQELRSLNLGAQVMDAPPAGKPSIPVAAETTNWWPMALAGSLALAAEAVHWLYGGFHWTVPLLALLAIVIGGLPTYKKGLIALRHLNLNMNALMSLAVTGAMLIGQWPEAAMVMVLFSLAEVIETKSLDRARKAVHGLMELIPEVATIRQADGSWQEIPASAVPLDAVARVRPGERIALDGVVISGRSTVNQAPITGESLPLEKAEHDPVFAGTINASGSFEYRVTALATNTTLARIIHAVEAAQGRRAPTQRFVDQFARVYTPAVFAASLVTGLVPPLAFGTPWLESIYMALVLLVIACPCALVISTPVTIVSGLAAAARKGILIKGGVYLEGGRRLALLVLDKTGTITHGRPEQTDFTGFTPDEDLVRRLAAGLATRSDHPVSQAIARAAPDSVALTVTGFSALPGRGVRGHIDGQLYYLGNHRLIDDLGLLTSALEDQLDQLERQGKTAILLTTQSEVLGLFAVADTVKHSSRQAIAELHELGIRTMMLSGDNVHTAGAIARQVGIDEVRGNQLPEDKTATIASLIGSKAWVGMVGDGINDAPALARADIGFAMGAAGTDVAIETADVALMDDDLRKLPAFVRLSRAATAILIQNISFALSTKALFIALTFTGHATMWMAVFADMGVSLLVVFNSLRLLRK